MDQIGLLVAKLMKWRDEVHDFFVKQEPVIYHAVDICWDEQADEVMGYGLMEQMVMEFQEQLKKHGVRFRNLSFFAKDEGRLGYDEDRICVESEEEQKLVHRLYVFVLQFHVDRDPSLKEYLFYEDGTPVFPTLFRVRQCPNCLMWENADDFAWNQMFHAEVCNHWSFCREGRLYRHSEDEIN